MQKYQIPWGQWYEQSTRTLTFPDDWDVRYCAMQHLETLTKEQIPWLFAMTPHLFRIGKAGAARLAQAQTLEDRASCVLNVYRK